jgi:hypothetical protein
MSQIAKPGSFYLGKEFDLEHKLPMENTILYNSNDLVTHAVCVGMTGSGKTGLCIDLLEEAALNGVSAIVIDPKGDMANLMLSFPNLSPKEFEPWVNPDNARNSGLPVEEFARLESQRWKKGLAEWNLDEHRIQEMRERADFTVYTPGSSSGMPVSFLKSFEAPPVLIREEGDLFRELITSTVSNLLGVLGITKDPVKCPEHVLLSNIFSFTWRQGQDFDLKRLIKLVQLPPFKKVGILDIEKFYPEKKRKDLAVLLNNLISSPSYRSWIEGEPMDIGNFLRSKPKSKISIFSIAHLSDQERMFFVTILLNQLIAWMRMQPGTPNLRAIIYFDELYGYMPPTAMPPSKKPLLTILKQGRAFGLGAVLATQNPVDLDYKGLGNAGTWFIGRLQTDRDRDRMLDGLSSGENEFNRADFEDIISGLEKRVFILHNVHKKKPVLFQSRWSMSYLAGPLTREQISKLYPGKQGLISMEPEPIADIRGKCDVPGSVLKRIQFYKEQMEYLKAEFFQDLSHAVQNKIHTFIFMECMLERLEELYELLEPFHKNQSVGRGAAYAILSEIEKYYTALAMTLVESGIFKGDPMQTVIRNAEREAEVQYLRFVKEVRNDLKTFLDQGGRNSIRLGDVILHNTEV